jgi:hypothetical protein
VGSRRKVPVFGSGDCSTRCLPPGAVEAAREQLGEGEARQVPFVCEISGEPSAAVLVGEVAAERILDAGPGLLRDRTEARALASLAEATLCACDVATLLGRPQPEAEGVLRNLVVRGLAEERAMRGMPYFCLTPEGRALLERALNGSQGRS